LDSELHEHLAEVVLDRARTDEELGADLRVGVTVAGKRRDLKLLRRQRVAHVCRSAARGLAGGDQLPTRALGECFRAYVDEPLVGRAKALACVGTALLAPEPLAEQQLTPRELERGMGLRQPFDRLAV